MDGLETIGTYPSAAFLVFSCMVISKMLMMGCAHYGERVDSWLLKAVIEPASAIDAGREFHCGMVRYTEEVHRGEDGRLALGRNRVCGFF